MSKYSALKVAKEKIKKLEGENEHLRIVLADTRDVCQSLRTNTVLVSRELEEVQLTFDKQQQTLRLAGATIRDLQKSRKRLKLYCKVLTATLTTVILLGAFSL